MFIGRRQDGSIYGAWSTRQPDDADHSGMEEVADDHPDVIAFLAPKVAQKQETVADLRAVLIAKGVITAQDVSAVADTQP